MPMINTLALVEQFHRIFGHPVRTSPCIDDAQLNKLRVDLIREEADELATALTEGNLVEVLDALTDLQYVLDGAYLAFGLARFRDLAFIEVHASNMSKLADDGSPIRRKDGKILKGPNYREPNLNATLRTFATNHPSKDVTDVKEDSPNEIQTCPTANPELKFVTIPEDEIYKEINGTVTQEQLEKLIRMETSTEQRKAVIQYDKTNRS